MISTKPLADHPHSEVRHLQGVFVLSDKAEQAILDVLRINRSCGSIKLIQLARIQTKLDDASIREAIWRLIDRGNIALTWDWKLKSLICV